jgi:hypothetical protein
MSVECVVRGPNHPFVPSASTAPDKRRQVWCSRVRSVRSPFGGPGPGPGRRRVPGGVRERVWDDVRGSGPGYGGVAYAAADGTSIGCDSPRPFRLSEKTYRIEPITMIENTLITRSTITIVAASVGGRP